VHARILVVLLGLVGLVLSTTPAGAGGGRTLVVDDDRAQCRNAGFTTIQAAVAAATAGDRIRVCPGVYAATTVDKPLRLEGSTSRLGSKRCLDRGRGEDPTQDSIVNGAAGAPAFRVGANDVEIRGFTIQNTTNDAGISVPGTFSGTRIRDNVIQENTFGVYLNSSGARTSKIERNCVRDNNKPGSSAGNGVYSDQGVRGAEIERNTFTGHTNAAIVFVGPAGAQERLKIERNELQDDAPIILAKVTRSEIERNSSVGSEGSGIFFGGGVTDVSVKKNEIRDCAFTGINLRTDPANFGTAVVNSANTIEDNRVVGCGDAGIRLRDGATRNLVRDNRVSRNGTDFDGDGIGLENADDNVVRGNKSDDNRRDGLRADSASSGNRIEKNRLSGNREHDCHDDSTGSGTAGTANTWRDNRGATENRSGLCRDKAVRKVKGDDDDDDDDAKDKKRKKKDKKHKDKKDKDHDNDEDDDE
jgi:parallel beta-helix repeat protein